MIERDENGVAHIVGLSGGHDSSILSVLLQEREPRPYNYLCTPTGDELPEMFAHLRNMGERLGKRIIPVMSITLKNLITREKSLPNFRHRWCTRVIKIEPYRKFLLEERQRGPVVSYVGLRADEPGRAGGAYSDIDGVTMRFPLREWGMGEDEVQAELAARGIVCPMRTDCARCYHQRIGEWFLLWLENRDIFLDAEHDEERTGYTFRTPGRDSWPSALKDLRARFEAGEIPATSLNRMAREHMKAGSCRVCSL
jgi:3'-phosphoadenosine 5'-phosphosulfate sulfotransferase (PAPS reductase)/FAD synthetase